MSNKKQSDAEILDSIEAFDFDDYTDGAEMIKALFDRKEKIRSLVVESDLSDNPTYVSDERDKNKK